MSEWDGIGTGKLSLHSLGSLVTKNVKPTFGLEDKLIKEKYKEISEFNQDKLIEKQSKQIKKLKECVEFANTVSGSAYVKLVNVRMIYEVTKQTLKDLEV